MNGPQSITLVGCGKMGQALLRGWLNNTETSSSAFTVIDPASLPASFTAAKNVSAFPTIAAAAGAIKNSGALLLAVKPQIMQEICTALKPVLPPETLLLSIAAGQTLGNFAQYFSAQQPAIRIMPNTPAAIGKGIAVAVAGVAATTDHITTAEKLMRPTGPLLWLKDEALMDAVTAVSGSGPAYLFYFIEALTRAAEKAGLPADTAQQLARQTVIGSAALAENEAGTDVATLRKNVTSPGGTTAAALEKLMDGHFDQILEESVQAATKRGKELSS